MYFIYCIYDAMRDGGLGVPSKGGDAVGEYGRECVTAEKTIGYETTESIVGAMTRPKERESNDEGLDSKIKELEGSLKREIVRIREKNGTEKLVSSIMDFCGREKTNEEGGTIEYMPREGGISSLMDHIITFKKGENELYIRVSIWDPKEIKDIGVDVYGDCDNVEKYQFLNEFYDFLKEVKSTDNK